MLGLVSGTLGGYLLGKNSGDKIAQEEVSTGKKEVKQPGFWNWKLAQGYLMGSVVSVGATLLTLKGAPGAGLIHIVGGLAPLAGMIYGGIKGKELMQVEFNHAREIERKNDIATVVEKVRSLQPEQGTSSPIPPTQSTQEASQSDTKKFTQQEEARRAASNSQASGMKI